MLTIYNYRVTDNASPTKWQHSHFHAKKAKKEGCRLFSAPMVLVSFMNSAVMEDTVSAIA